MGGGEAGGKRGRYTERHEKYKSPTGEALTEFPPKRLRIKLLGGLLGFAN